MKLTKRIISLIMAMLMLCSGMVVTAFADGETTEGGTTTVAPVVEVVKHTLNANNCYVDIANVEISKATQRIPLKNFLLVICYSPLINLWKF